MQEGPAVRLVSYYASFATEHPFLLLLAVVIISFGAYIGVSHVELEATSHIRMFPQELEVVRGYEIAQDSFFGSESMFVVVYLDPEEGWQRAVKDIREPSVARYIHRLQGKIESLESVTGSRSYVDLLYSRGGVPPSREEIEIVLENSPSASKLVSRDKTTALIRLRVGDIGGEEKEFTESVESTISSISRPPGVEAIATGDPAIGKVFMEHTAKDMQKTTRFSFFAILVITALVLYSIRFGALPLMSVSIGTFWAFGLIGALGIKISSMMAGVASMIMGIGIDFAIQIIGRFMQELKGYFGEWRPSPREAMRVTLENVVQPMAVTTLAALIGFRAMSLGELKFMEDLGTVMSLGVLTCMLSALTLVPSLVLISDKMKEVGV